MKKLAFSLVFAAVSILSVQRSQSESSKIKHVSSNGQVSIETLGVTKHSTKVSFGGDEAQACYTVSWTGSDGTAYYCARGCTGGVKNGCTASN